VRADSEHWMSGYSTTTPRFVWDSSGHREEKLTLTNIKPLERVTTAFRTRRIVALLQHKHYCSSYGSRVLHRSC